MKALFSILLFVLAAFVKLAEATSCGNGSGMINPGGLALLNDNKSIITWAINLELLLFTSFNSKR